MASDAPAPGESPRGRARSRRPDPPTDAFRAWVGVLIAVASILGAVVVWQASVESSNASDAGREGIQQQILQQQKRGEIDAGVARDFRLFADFQEHVMNWRLLTTQAADVAERDPKLAADLRDQARDELTLARGIRPRIQPFDRPGFGDENGVVEFDPRQAAAALAEADLELTGLRPDRAFAEADDAHSRALRLVGIGVLLAAALLFLTFAQVARRGARTIFAGAGVVVLSIGGLLFALVEGA